MSNSLFSILVILTLIFFVLTFFIVYMAIFHNRRKQFFRQELLRTKIEIQEQTMRNISQEIHDNLGQLASLIKIQLMTVELSSTEDALKKLQEAKELTRDLITGLKTMSQSLDSGRLLHRGLFAALETEASRLQKTGFVDVALDTSGPEPSSLTGDQMVILYRMVQETLNNAVKHSQAKQIKITAVTLRNLFSLAISDNGIGFDLGANLNNTGAGLFNLHARSKLINARLVIESNIGSGTRISIDVPLQH